MASYRLGFAWVAFLLTSCLGQERGGVDPRVALPVLRHVLGTAHASGSLAYWGRCDPHAPYPDFPSFQPLSNYSGPLVEVLSKIFANDPKMQVTQEPNGLIRIVETDVPRDLLDVKIRRVTFPEFDMLGGPNIAMQFVLSAPEVKAFRKTHKIGPLTDRWTGSADPSKPPMSGTLYDVTVSQALDHILQTFPGFWIYENCPGKNGGREVYFGFETDLTADSAQIDTH